MSTNIPKNIGDRRKLYADDVAYMRAIRIRNLAREKIEADAIWNQRQRDLYTNSTGTTCDTPGQTKCGSRCVNTTTNGANCGSCGKICYSAAPNCCNGGCVNFQKDTSNCGSCGHKCGSGSTCAYGSCRIKVMGTVYSAITVLPSIAK